MSQATAVRQRRALDRLSGQASSATLDLWSSLDTSDVPAVRTAMLKHLPAIGDSYSMAAGTLGADFYDIARSDAGAAGKFAASPAKVVQLSRYKSLIGWGIGPLFGNAPDSALALSKIDGGLQRIIANSFRDTVTQASTKDAAARGWAREGVGGCDFCAMLIGRGAVYSEDTASFDSHDHCNCVAVPVFG